MGEARRLSPAGLAGVVRGLHLSGGYVSSLQSWAAIPYEQAMIKRPLVAPRFKLTWESNYKRANG